TRVCYGFAGRVRPTPRASSRDGRIDGRLRHRAARPLDLPPHCPHSGAYRERRFQVSPTTAAAPTIELMLEINAAFNARDVDRIMSFFADDATFLMARRPPPPRRRGPAQGAPPKGPPPPVAALTGQR